MENQKTKNLSNKGSNNIFGKNKQFWYLLIIFVFVLGFRLYFSFSDSNFSDGSAYTNLRYINYVSENFKPVTYDPLSYSGREVIDPPLFYILMALFSFGNVFMLKIVPEILLAFVSVLVYFIAKELCDNEDYAFASGIISGFIPVFLLKTSNQISSFCLVLPLMLFLLYCAFNLEKKFYLWGFIVCSFILPLTSPWALLFVLTMVVYLFLLGGGFLSASRLKKEAIMASSFLIILMTLILFKKPFLEYGFSLIWQNIPINILTDNFRDLSIIDVLLEVGVIAALLGGIGIYYGIVKEKKKSVYLFSALILSVLFLLVFRLITLLNGLLFVGIALTIFVGLGLKAVFEFFSSFRIAFLLDKIFIVLLVLIFIFSIIPNPIFSSSSVYESLKSNKIDPKLIKDMQWASVNLNSGSVLLGNIYEGEIISGVAFKKNVADVNFVLAPRAEERLQDISFIYSTPFEAKALELLAKYKVDAIYFSLQTKALFDVSELKYTEDEKCFEKQGNFYIIKCLKKE